MYNYLFPPTETKKMPSLSSTDVKSMKVEVEEIKKGKYH